MKLFLQEVAPLETAVTVSGVIGALFISNVLFVCNNFVKIRTTKIANWWLDSSKRSLFVFVN